MDMRKTLLGGASAIALGAGLLSPASAQQSLGLVNTQSGFRADAATNFISTTAANCTTSQASVANLTLTATPPAGQYVYLTGVYFEVSANATAATSATFWTSTNLTGSPVWITPVTASGTGNQTGLYTISELYPTGLKATAPGTAVTIVPSATTASTYICAKAVGYFAP